MKSKSYEEFVEKFKPKLTTDDCYTPPAIYEVIRDWACNEFKIDPAVIVRPFYPGGDYEHYEYPDGCVVLDNPPFSILSKICAFYLERGIKFFLFAPSLTCFQGRHTMDICHIICDCNIVYENGANVRTSFVTNFDAEVIARTAPDLTKAVNAVSDMLRREQTRELPKYSYPDHVITSALMQRYAKYGVELRIMREDCTFIRALDSQRECGKTVFGGGLLLSDRAAAERAAAERAAAERAAAHVWTLSDREREIVASLGKTEGGVCLNA